MDICLNCGKTGPHELWGRCTCVDPQPVHIGKCGCGAAIGYIIDDDYCSPETLACAQCLAKAQEKAEKAV